LSTRAHGRRAEHHSRPRYGQILASKNPHHQRTRRDLQDNVFVSFAFHDGYAQVALAGGLLPQNRLQDHENQADRS
jgi:hypothetical protein